jgi:hypothetical protein
MMITTLFEPLKARSFAGYSLVRTADLQKLLRRLQNAEVGFDYAVRREIPRLQSSRDAHMLKAQKLKDELACLKDQAA